MLGEQTHKGASSHDSSNRRIIVRLIGGLGNQLFQLQYGLTLQKKIGGRLFLDDSFLASSSKAHESVAISELIEAYPIIRLSCFDLKIRRSLERLFHKLKLIIPQWLSPIFVFENSKYSVVSMPYIILDGFWQDSANLNQNFIEMLRQKLSKVHVKAGQESSVCVHIRRGDYLTNRHWFVKQQQVLPMDYYFKAFDDFRAHLKSPVFDIYTDDEAWAGEMFRSMPDVKIVPSRDLKPFNLLAQMASYKNFIIANSTLSWWAAVAAADLQKRVVLPGMWGKNMNSAKYQLADWVAI